MSEPTGAIATLTPGSPLTGGANATAAQPAARPSGAAASATPAPASVQTSGAASAGTATSAAPQSAPGATGSVDLDALLKDPKIAEELDRRLVKPAISKVEFNRDKLRAELEANIRRQVASETTAAQEAQLVQKAKSGDAAAKEALANLRISQYEQQQRSEQQTQERRRLEASVAQSLIEQVLDIKPDTIPAEARVSPEALKTWALKESPAIQAVVQAALQQAKSDTESVQGAKAAADFGTKLSVTPSPQLDGGGVPAGTAMTTPLSAEEWTANRGNADWRKANRTRIDRALQFGYGR